MLSGSAQAAKNRFNNSHQIDPETVDNLNATVNDAFTRKAKAQKKVRVTIATAATLGILLGAAAAIVISVRNGE